MDCVVRVVRVSGTIRKSEEELIRRAKGDVVKAKRAEEEGHGDVLAKLVGAAAPSVAAPTSQPESFEDDELDYGSESGED